MSNVKPKMSDFSIFEKFTPKAHLETPPSAQEECVHENVLTDNGMSMCSDCGLEIHKTNTTDVKNLIEPNRCFMRKSKEKTIYQDLQNLNISDHIKDIANDIYVECCNGKVHRGARRKAIIFASVFHAYKLDNSPQSCESLIKLFQMKRKDALKGLKFINEHTPKKSPIKSLYITPEHIIHEFLSHFHVSEDKKNEILDMYHSVKDKSVILNRSRPQSVASGVIWYWICTNQKQISIKEFIKKVDLSELTVNKMAKEIARLNNTTL